VFIGDGSVSSTRQKAVYVGNFIAIGRFFCAVSCTGTRQVVLVCITKKSYTGASV